MMLEITIGETICVRMDDEMTDQRPTPEQVEDYLTRLGRTASKMWADMPTFADDTTVPAPDADQD